MARAEIQPDKKILNIRALRFGRPDGRQPLRLRGRNHWRHFKIAARLRVYRKRTFDAWEQVIQSDDEEAASSISMIIAMNRIDEGTSELTEGAIDEIDRMVPNLIPQMVRTLNAWTKSRHMHGALQRDDSVPDLPANVAPFRSKKVGRNETCPCGSGRKYKRCCGKK